MSDLVFALLSVISFLVTFLMTLDFFFFGFLWFGGLMWAGILSSLYFRSVTIIMHKLSLASRMI